MFWTLHDPLVKRDVGGPRSPVHDIHLPRAGKRSAPQTVETVLFLLEDTSTIPSESPTPVLH